MATNVTAKPTSGQTQSNAVNTTLGTVGDIAGVTTHPNRHLPVLSGSAPMDELTGSRNARDAEDTIPYPVPAAPPIAGDGLGAGGATGSGGDRARAESNDDEITDLPKVGDLDPNGLKIDKIFKSTRRFVIYEAAGSVRYILPKSSNTGRTLAKVMQNSGKVAIIS
jgi:hypothetical protein